jgi:hypothetical protein
MSANGRKKGGRDREPVALALADGRTIADAAAANGVGERTVRRWLDEAPFREWVRALRHERYGQAAGQAAANNAKAVQTLVAILDSPNEANRLGAAKALLTFSFQFRKADEFAARLDELERLHHADRNAGPPAGPPGAPAGPGPPDGQPDPAAAAGGPGGGAQAGGDHPGPVASDDTCNDMQKCLDAMFEADGEEHDGGGAGAA